MLVTYLIVACSVCLAECDKLRKDGFRSSQYYSQGPTFSDSIHSNNSLHDEDEDEDDKKVSQRHTHREVCRHVFLQKDTGGPPMWG